MILLVLDFYIISNDFANSLNSNVCYYHDEEVQSYDCFCCSCVCYLDDQSKCEPWNLLHECVFVRFSLEVFPNCNHFLKNYQGSSEDMDEGYVQLLDVAGA